MKRAPSHLFAPIFVLVAAATSTPADARGPAAKAPTAPAPFAWPPAATAPTKAPSPKARTPKASSAKAASAKPDATAPIATAPIATAPIVEERPVAAVPDAAAQSDAPVDAAANAPNTLVVETVQVPLAVAAVDVDAPNDVAAAADAAPADAAPADAADAGVDAAPEAATAPEVTAPVAAAAPAPNAAEPAPAPAPTVDAAAAVGLVAEAAPPSTSTTSPLKLLFFADAYANYQSSEPGTAVPWHRAFDSAAFGSGSQNGFSLAWTGLDVSYAGTGWGASTSLRFGPAVPQFYAADIGPVGIENILQAYVTWAPLPQLTLDLGQFGTPFGAEVAESWRNKNYTRGGLYYGMQPFWHTGARATAVFSENWKAVAFVANGTNNSLLAGNSPNLGAQVSYATPTFTLAVGTLQAIDAATNASGFDRFFDVVATLTLDKFTAILNADYNVNATDPLGVTGTSFGGVSLTAAYQLTDSFGMAVRGEALSDFDNALYQVQKVDGRVDITTGTLTLDYKPIPNSSNIVLRWDNRAEWSNQAAYFDGGGNAAQLWFTSVLGLVATTDGLF